MTKRGCCLQIGSDYRSLFISFGIGYFYKLLDYSDSRQLCKEAWSHLPFYDMVSSGFLHTVGLKMNGTVVAVGQNKNGECKVTGWTDTVTVSAGANYTVGLKSDGTVVAVGLNKNGQFDVIGWKNIKLPD